MKPAFIVLFTVFLFVPSHTGLSREEATLSGQPLSAQTLQLNNQSLPVGKRDGQKVEARTTGLLDDLPLYFVENRGQVDKAVRYSARTKDGLVYFTGSEVVYKVLLRDKDRGRASTGDESAGHSSPLREEIVRLSFVGANKEVRLDGKGEQEGKFSYFRGNDPEKWVSGARSYQKIVYRELYPGIDLVVAGRQGRLKNEYVVRAGGAPSAIRLKYDGAKNVEVNEKGQLEVQMSTGTLIEDVPLSYQVIDGQKKDVKSGYRIAADRTVQFRVDGYRTDIDLIIDPLTYSTFLGGSDVMDVDTGFAIAIDGSGNAYITGYTQDSSFPTTAGAYDTGHNGSDDVFITKLNPAGNALVYSTLLGGTGQEEAHAITIDKDGNAYVTGLANSNDFPTTAGAYDTNGSDDAFITKLNPAGNALVYSTYLGGWDYEEGEGIAIDGDGNAYVTGFTTSSDFPTTAGAHDTSYSGTGEAFITKLNPAGNALVYSTFLGGGSYETGYGIAIDTAGCAYIAGTTVSTDFPTTSGAFDTSYAGGGDVFVTKLNSAGSNLIFSTFLGGSLEDRGLGIAIDGTSSVYVSGYTYSPNFPASVGAYDTSLNGVTDMFVTKLNDSGSALIYSTYLGGSSDESEYFCHPIAVDASGNAYIKGMTWSSDFPTTPAAIDTTLNGENDGFIAKLNSTGTALLYSTYLGGSGSDDEPNGIAVDPSGNVYIAGYTDSSDFPTTVGAYDTTYAAWDAFVVKLPTRYPDIHQPIADINFGAVNIGNYTDQTTTIYNDGDETLTVSSITRTSGSTEFAYTAPSVPFAVSAWSSRSVTVRFTPTSAGVKSAVFSVSSNDPDEPNVTFNVSGTGVAVSETVSAPNAPSGPASGQANTSYTYATGGSVSSLGHGVQYLLDWGDGTDSGWLAVGTTSAQKAWSSANTYNLMAKARCATDTGIESSWSSSYSVVISGQGYDNSPSSYKVLPECIWAAATGGGTWVSEVQITDLTGGSVVSAYFDYGAGNRRGPFTLWTSPGANRNIKYANILSSMDALDSEAFTYYGRVGAVEFSTQDTAHKIQVMARTLNGNYSKTFPGLNLTDSNTAGASRRMILQNFVNNAAYRSSCGFFNPTADSVTVEFRLVHGNGNTLGSPFSRTLVGRDFQSFSPFNQAGVPYPSYSYDNAVLWITPTSGSGKVMVFGASANNTSNDPAAHIGVHYQGVYDNSPRSYQVIPECIWAAATGGGTWVSEVQITDLTGGSVVAVSFDYGAGNRSGPFTLWTSPGVNRNVKYANILSWIDALDAGALVYYGRVGAVEFSTQDASHKIQVVARTLNGNYSKTFPGLNLTDSNTANTARRMMLQNFVNNATYRSSCGFFNPTADSVTAEFKLIDANGNQIGSTITRTLVGYDFQSFSPFNQAGVPYPANSFDNVVLWITPTSGSGKVMVFGASANNTSNDPAAHIGVQYQ